LLNIKIDVNVSCTSVQFSKISQCYILSYTLGIS